MTNWVLFFTDDKQSQLNLKNDFRIIHSNNLKKYDGFVYCVEMNKNTTSHALIIRKNGKIVLCGNSVSKAQRV